MVQITDLINLATLRELNCSLSDALGLEMALYDGDDTPLTSSALCATWSETSASPMALEARR